MPLNLCNQLVL